MLKKILRLLALVLSASILCLLFSQSVFAEAPASSAKSNEKIVSIAAGGGYTMLLKQDGTVWSWGSNISGQLGDGTVINKKTPVQVKGLSGVSAIDVGCEFSLALKKDGTVWQFGAYAEGSADWKKFISPSAVQVKNLKNIRCIAAGGYADIQGFTPGHSIALEGDSTIWVWGSDTVGERNILIPEKFTPQAPAASGSQKIVFEDKEFERMVRLALNKPNGGFTAAELAKVDKLDFFGISSNGSNSMASSQIDGVYTIKSYKDSQGNTYTEKGKIKVLNDLKHFTGLLSLRLDYQEISDITPISHLKNLESLSLQYNQVRDIAALAKLSRLRYVYLFGNSVEDISPLGNKPALIGLHLQKNKIRDIGALSGNKTLLHLSLSQNSISDISVLKSLTTLNSLDLSYNSVTDITPLKSLGSLKYLTVYGLKEVDVKILDELKQKGVNVNRDF